MINKKSFDQDGSTWQIILVVFMFALVIALCLWPVYLSDQKFQSLDSTSDKLIRANTFSYKKHRYKLFEKNNALSNTYIVHDPNCICGEETEEENDYVRPKLFHYKGHRFILFDKKRTVDAANIVS